jgi:leader peptidase (prepilin peptidase)/N-methyltransferase
MPYTLASAVLAAVLGAAAGSFLNVIVYRLPRRESVISPGSHCTSCGAAVKPYDNVPVFAWLWLRGHCRACDSSISPRYPLVEAVTAGLCVAVVLTRASAWGTALGLLLVLMLVPVAFIDLEHHIIPNRILAPVALAAVVAGSALDPSGELERVIAAAAAGGLLLAAALCYPRGMGMGDVKLAAVLGLLLGRAVAPAMFAALICAIVVGVVMLARAEPSQRRSTGVPFLAVGALVGLFAGHALIGAYLHHLL